MKLLLAFILSFTFLNAKNIESIKMSCIQQSAYPNKTLAEQKKILIEQAKQESLEELYGAVIFSSTDILDGKLQRDSIQSRAIGAVRVKGNPKFKNGENLGEICASVTSYITPEDIKKYSPKEIKLKHFCFADQKVTVSQIKPLAKRKAYIEVISQYKPSLKNLTMDQAESLVHGFTINNDNFDFSSGAYCFDATATILPYELEFQGKRAEKYKKSTGEYHHGLVANFYALADTDFEHPLDTEVLTTLNLTYHSFPASGNLQHNVPYIIKIDGFVKVDKTTTANLKLFADVYSVTLSINGKKILDKGHRKGGISLPAGYSKINLLIKSANRYDTRIISDALEHLYYKN